MQLDDVGMTQQFHRLQLARQELLLEVERRALLVDDLERHSPFQLVRERPLHLVAPARHAIRYDTRCYFNVRSKANMSQLNLPHGTDN